jgi:hypothetical protein
MTAMSVIADSLTQWKAAPGQQQPPRQDGPRPDGQRTTG